MKLNKVLVTLYILGIIAGGVLVFMPVILGGIESELLGYICIFAGFGIFTLSLCFLELHVSKRKRPERLRRERIEANDERTVTIRDKAGAKTLTYLLFMLLVSTLVFSWVDTEIDYIHLVWWILLMSAAVYFGHIHYYKKRL